MSFVSIGELAKERFKQVVPETTKIYSSVGFSDCVEIFCGQAAARCLHELYWHNGLLVIAATTEQAYEIATFRRDEMVEAMQQLGWGVGTIRIL